LGVSLTALGTALYALRARSRPPFPPLRGDVSALTGNDRMTHPPTRRLRWTSATADTRGV